MRWKPVLAAWVAVVVWVSSAGAEAGLYLTWDDCAASASAISDYAATCGTDFGEQTLYVAFSVDQPIDSVIAIEVTVDLQHAWVALPAWWQLDPAGCRFGGLRADADFSGHAACADFWGGLAAEDPPVVYLTGQPGGAPNRARVVVTEAVAPTNPVRLEAGPMYYAVKLVLGNLRTSQCSGCSGAACFVLNSILVGRLPGALGGDLTVSQPGPNHLNWATWQGGAGAACDAVPVRPTTWGRLKALYR